MDSRFVVRPDELNLRYRTPTAPRRLSFDHLDLSYAHWHPLAKDKLTELLGVNEHVDHGDVKTVRQTSYDGLDVTALVMRVDDTVSLPAYLLRLAGEPPAPTGNVVLALHGHGQVDECLGLPGGREDYHHAFARVLAQAGHTVLLPELRGFGALYDLASGRSGEQLTYWQWGTHMTYTLLTDAFQNGRTLMGDTVEDLLRWERWLVSAYAVERLDVAGISWGGDLACTYPVLSTRVTSIFASGTLGSFTAIFSRCGNAPAHCIPGILGWLDRADIAGLNAPRPIALHYGELDVPGPDNGSASYNETVPDSIRHLRQIYAAADAGDAVSLLVSKDQGHEMDNAFLLDFLRP